MSKRPPWEDSEQEDNAEDAVDTWLPPPPGNALRFAVIAVGLVGLATAGTILFLKQEEPPFTNAPVSTTTLTSADAGATASGEVIDLDDVVATPTTQHVVTPWDLPSAPAVMTAKPSPAVVTARPSPAVAMAKPAMARPVVAMTKPERARMRERPPSTQATVDPSADEHALPDLDRAATAAGLNLEPPDAGPAQPSPESPPPAEVPADSQLER